MVTIMGTGSLTYEVVENWPTLPQGFILGDVAGAVISSKNRVYLYTRGEHPVVVLDLDGNFITSWGEGVFGSTHGIAIGPDDSIYTTDTRHHVIRKFTPEGKLLQTIGSPSEQWSGQPFCRPTHLAISPVSGDLFVADGYANSRIHRFSPKGELMYSWGEPGASQGQFVAPHNIVVDEDENIYVADRENHRIQVFSAKGEFLALWPGIWRAAGLDMDKSGNVYVAEMPAPVYFLNAPNVGHAISIYDKSGNLQTRFGDPSPGETPGYFTAPHGIAVDLRGDLYVCEMPRANMGPEWMEEASKNRGGDLPPEVRTVVKLARKG
jgi:DNA-binding beta-propeller fold protein YncE